MKILSELFLLVVSCFMFVFGVYISLLLLDWWGLIENVIVWQ